MTEPSELDNLIQKCKNSDPEAFNELFRLYSSRCYAYFYRLTGKSHLSDELLSDLFMRLIKKIHSFQGGSFEKWLFTVASNLFKDYLRRHYRRKQMIETKAEQLAQESADDSLDNEIVDNLQLAIEKLDPETAELITLRYYSEMSFKELAEMRQEPIGTTLSKVHRGLKKLREIMESL